MFSSFFFVMVITVILNFLLWIFGITGIYWIEEIATYELGFFDL